MKADRRARKLQRAAGRDIVIPGDLAIPDAEIADQGNQESLLEGQESRLLMKNTHKKAAVYK